MKLAERRHKDVAAAMGCVACLFVHGSHEPGPVELHHLRTGGWGKGDYMTLIPLCVEHHRGRFGVHGMGTRAFDAHYGNAEVYGDRAFTQARLLDYTLERIYG